MAIRGVAFDVDGTLYSNRLMFALSVPLLPGRLRLLRAFSDVRLELRRRGLVADFYHTQARLLAEALGVSVDEATETINRRIYRAWEDILRLVPLRRGVRKTLEELRGRGVVVAVSSDFPLARKLRILKLEDYWDAIVPAEETGALKPNPEPFEAICRALDMPSEELLYVGNNYDYDVLGAQRIGMKTAHISRRHRADSSADVTVSRFSDLLKWILSTGS